MHIHWRLQALSFFRGCMVRYGSTVKVFNFLQIERDSQNPAFQDPVLGRFGAREFHGFADFFQPIFVHPRTVVGYISVTFAFGCMKVHMSLRSYTEHEFVSPQRFGCKPHIGRDKQLAQHLYCATFLFRQKPPRLIDQSHSPVA